MLRIEQIFGGREVFSFGPEGIGGQGLLCSCESVFLTPSQTNDSRTAAISERSRSAAAWPAAVAAGGNSAGESASEGMQNSESERSWKKRKRALREAQRRAPM
jgi:hypothetical protein